MLSTIRGRGLQTDRFTFTSLLLACGRSQDVFSEQVCVMVVLIRGGEVLFGVLRCECGRWDCLTDYNMLSSFMS